MGAPALFMDRDGVINVDRGYVHRPEDVSWIDGAIDTIRLANQLGYECIVVTNQAGIARGFYSEQRFVDFSKWMMAKLEKQHARIRATYHCPFHPEGEGIYRHPDHPDRKPNPGMILRAAKDYGLDLRSSVMVGDQESDIVAACRAGIQYYALLGKDGPAHLPNVTVLRDHVQLQEWLKGMAAVRPENRKDD